VAVGTRTFEGLRRDGTGGNALRLRSTTGAAHASSDTRSCYDCHGDDYRTGRGNVQHRARGRGRASRSCPRHPRPASSPARRRPRPCRLTRPTPPDILAEAPTPASPHPRSPRG